MSSSAPLTTDRFPPFPIEAGDFRLSMGLRPIPPDEWLFQGPDQTQQLAERQALLDQRPNDVLACQPEAEPAALAVHSFVTQALNKPSSNPPSTGIAALGAIGRLVPEDMCILQSAGEGEPYCLAAAVLCFPNR